MKEKGVLLLKMPWCRVEYPSVGLGILKAILTKAGIGCDVLEAQMLILKWIRHTTYETFANTRMLGEFSFTHELQPEMEPNQYDVLKKICHDRETHEVWAENGNQEPFDPEHLMELALKVRNEIVPAYFDYLMERIDFDRYLMVGFNCVFDQTIASLSFAKRIKKHYPHIVTAFGGPAFRGAVGAHWQTVLRDFVDIVAYGDGEDVILPLVEAVKGRHPLSQINNISYRDERGEVVVNPYQNCNFPLSPTPNYDDFFALVREMEDDHQVRIKPPRMLLESSRGCWWGEKHHCTFCANDKILMSWRNKPAESVIAQLQELTERYGPHKFTFVDDIMPHKYWADLLPKLAEGGANYDIFYEQKANLTEKKIRLLAQGGVRNIQAGIESFSTALLKKMDKGVTGIQNIYCIYRCMLEGVRIYYNILFGFPDDQPEEYDQLLAFSPALYHLVPPRLTTWIRLSRFSPLTDQKERFGDYPLVPFWRYHLYFGDRFRVERGIGLDRFCFFYDNPIQEKTPAPLERTYKILKEQHYLWKSRFQTGSILFCKVEKDRVEVVDGRYREDPETVVLDLPHAAIMTFLNHGIATRENVVEALGGRFGDERIDMALDDLVRFRFVLAEGPRYVNIVFPESFYRSQDHLDALIGMGYRSEGKRVR